MSSSVKKLLLQSAIVIAGFAALVPLSLVLERSRPSLPAGFEDSDLTVQGSRLKGFALGMEGLIADWYWMRSLQYVGNKLLTVKEGSINIDDLRDLNPRLLYPYLQNATDLDPHFLAAYSYGALVMPAIDPQKAIAITEKGVANNPKEWRLYQYLGYIHWKLGGYDKAAAAYERGAEIEGAAPFMKLMAASMQTRGGDRETARAIFRQMLDDPSDPQVRITAERRLKELASLDQRDAIDRMLLEHKQRNGRCSMSLNELMPELAAVRLPEGSDLSVDRTGRLVDPTGAPYLLDHDTCRVKLDADHTGLPVR